MTNDTDFPEEKTGWLLENLEAMKMVQEGLEQAKQGQCDFFPRFKAHLDSEPFQKSGKVLDDSEYQQIADESSQVVDSAIESLKRAGMLKTVELIEASDNETQSINSFGQ